MIDKRMRKLIHRARRYYLAPSAPIDINESETKAALKVVTLDDIINESLREYKIKLNRARKRKQINYALLESVSTGNKSLNHFEILAKTKDSLLECEECEAAIEALTKRNNKGDIITYISLLEGDKLDKEKKNDFSDSDGIEPEEDEDELFDSDDDSDDDSDKEEIDLEEPDEEDADDAEGDLDAEEGDTVNLEKISITVTDIDRIKKELKDYGIPEDAIEEADVEDNEDQEDVRKGKVKIDSEYALELRDFFKEKYDIDLEEKLGIEIEESDKGDDGTNADEESDKDDKDDKEYSDDDIFKTDKDDDFDDFFGDDDEEGEEE